ncbi:MAG: hypothetical protein KAI50_13705 [Desulfobacterales bacterium]|nr:hypothetical protein [Desulfobacterales bacterium]
MDKLHLTKDGKMTHASTWLLCDDITCYTLQAHVTCAMFRETTKNYILDRKDFYMADLTIEKNVKFLVFL